MVSSSEDEEKDGSFNSKRGYSRCKSRRKNPSGAKKARISGSQSRLCRDSSVFDEVFNMFNMFNIFNKCVVDW